MHSEGTDEEKTVTFNGRETKVIDLLIGQGAAGAGINSDYDQITMTLIGDAGSITVYSVDSSFIPPASVSNSSSYLADGTELPFYRIGSNVIQDTSSISAFLGHVTRDNIESLSSRHRGLGSWSAFGSGDIDSSIGWYSTARSSKLMMIQPGTAAAGKVLKVHTRTINPTAEDQAFSITLSEPGGANVSSLRVEVPAGQPATWAVHEMAVAEGGRIPHINRPLTPEPYLWLGVNTLDMTTRGLIGLSAWAE
jgi:hypothetical protein